MLPSLRGCGKFVFNGIEWVIGVRFDREHLNTRNSFDAIMIVLATYFIFPIYSGYLDVFAASVGGDLINRFAIEGFRLAFLMSAAWLILIALFSKARLSILKFLSLNIPGMVLGIVLTFLLTQLVGYVKLVWRLDEITLFVMAIYPLLFSYFVRMKINQFSKPRDRPKCPERMPLERRFQESVYVE